MSQEASPEPTATVAVVNPVDDPAVFIAQFQQCLSPHLQECFSEETKKLRNVLLALTIALFLLALGALKFTGQGDFAGLKFDIERRASVETAVGLVVAFFVVIYCVRCYIEWTSWKLKSLSPEWSLVSLNNHLTTAQVGLLIERNELTRQVREMQAAALRPAYPNVRDTLDAYSAMTAKLAQLDGLTTGERQTMLEELNSLILKYVPKVKRARIFRFWLEAVFPALFGGYAVLGAFFPVILLKF